jgi:hypothetical protein
MDTSDERHSTTSASPRRSGRRVRLPVVLALVAVAASATGAITVDRATSCSRAVEIALGEIEPQREGDLSLRSDLVTIEPSWDACTTRVQTSRSGADVVAYYASQFERNQWRVRLHSLAGQCSSGEGQCHGLRAVGAGVCFALTTDTVKREQAVSAQRTTVFVFAVECSDISDPGERADFER